MFPTTPSVTSVSTQTDSPWELADAGGRTDWGAVDRLYQEWLPRLNEQHVDRNEALVAVMEYFQSGKDDALQAAVNRRATRAPSAGKANESPSQSLPGLALAAIQREADVRYVVAVCDPRDLTWESPFTRRLRELPSDRVHNLVAPQGKGGGGAWIQEREHSVLKEMAPGQAVFMTTPSADALMVAKQSDGKIVVLLHETRFQSDLRLLQGDRAQERVDNVLARKGSFACAMIVPR